MFESFLNNTNNWLSEQGLSSDIVFSSRLRLARNFQGYNFPYYASLEQKREIVNIVKEVYKKVDILKDAIFIVMDELDNVDKQFLLERHLISREHMSVTNKEKGTKALILSSDEKISIMINEEDHLRIQVIAAGLNLEWCWQTINRIDDSLAEFIKFSFTPEFGYLTSCPTNVGTALRASCMLRLPALVLTKKINKILQLLAKISFATRGLFGEGTASVGDFFQVSNQVSLGLPERELIDSLWGIVNQLITQELDARQILIKKYRYSLEDNVWRALGALRYCRLITSKEALAHLSMLVLGINLGIIKGISKEMVTNLFILIQPAHLQKIEGKNLKEKDRDYLRAKLLREKLN